MPVCRIVRCFTDDPNMNHLFNNKIERGEYRMAKHFSDDAKDVISHMLAVDPQPATRSNRSSHTHGSVSDVIFPFRGSTEGCQP